MCFPSRIKNLVTPGRASGQPHHATVTDPSASRAPPSNYPPPRLFKAIKHDLDDTLPPPVLTQPSGSGAEDQEAANTTSVSLSFPVYGPFDLLYCIQTGSSGSAWGALDHATGKLLCLKIFQSLSDPHAAQSAKTELKMFRRMVKSKGGERGKQFIIELSRSIQHGTVVFFAMELMTTDLATYQSAEPERCKMNARRWIAQMALGIDSLHDMGIIHRDIKSENILIDSRENIRIVDFGLSYIEPNGGPIQQGVGYASDVLGTLPYIAPEMLRNKDLHSRRRLLYGAAVDWWALGCILYELESETHLVLFDFEVDTLAYIAWTQKQSQPEQTYSKFADLDPVVVSLLNGLLQVRPSLRFSLSDLEKHEYFMYDDGTSEFDDAAARALDMPELPHLVPHSSRDDSKPIMVVEAARLSSVFDWTNLKWADRVDN